MGCLFFSRRDSCIPLFELLYLRDDWKTANKINVPALMNAIWKYYPEYAASHNLEEQFGANDLLGVILNTMGEDVELSGSVENVISMSPHAGTNFFQWQSQKIRTFIPFDIAFTTQDIYNMHSYRMNGGKV